jgi:hypothetical protein
MPWPLCRPVLESRRGLPVGSDFVPKSGNVAVASLNGNEVYISPYLVNPGDFTVDSALIAHEVLHNLGMDDPTIQTKLGIDVTPISSNIGDKLQTDCFGPSGPSAPALVNKIMKHRKLATVSMIVVAITALPHPGRGQVSYRLPHGTVHVAVFGSFGEKIQAAEIHLRSHDGKRDSMIQNSVIDDVPYMAFILFRLGVAGPSESGRLL